MVSRSDIITRAVVKHNGRYTYGAFGSILIGTRIPIICESHGTFFQTVRNHAYRGTGCPECKKQKLSNDRRRSLDNFIQLASATHRGKYTYNQTKYINTHKKVTITCPEHGDFFQTPNNHLHNTQGCPSCGGRPHIDTSEFVLRARRKYGMLFDYSNVAYTNAHTPIDIRCSIHGWFTQQPDSHITSRYGCPSCGYTNLCGRYTQKTFDRTPSLVNKPALLYLIELFHDNERFLKLGICTTTIYDRFTNHTNAYQWKEIMVVSNTLKCCFDMEQHLLQSSTWDRVTPNIKFDGHTECLSVHHKHELIEEISAWKLK